MKSTKTTQASGSSRKIRPAATPEARENQMISLAEELAMQQLLDGTASAQVITHYLKLGSTRERQELENMRLKAELDKAKTKAIEDGKRMEVLYENAVKAMKRYSGQGGDEDEEDY